MSVASLMAVAEPEDWGMMAEEEMICEETVG